MCVRTGSGTIAINAFTTTVDGMHQIPSRGGSFCASGHGVGPDPAKKLCDAFNGPSKAGFGGGGEGVRVPAVGRGPTGVAARPGNITRRRNETMRSDPSAEPVRAVRFTGSLGRGSRTKSRGACCPQPDSNRQARPRCPLARALDVRAFTPESGSLALELLRHD